MGINQLISWLKEKKGITPLITFRILFGALMMVGAIRFMYYGWIERLYGEPKFFFKYYGFEWVTPLSTQGMYVVFILIALSAFCIMLGLFYRLATIIFLLTFAYAELIDATNYLNHYYLVCLLAFLMIFIPANRAFSLDVWRNPDWRLTQVPAWTIYILIAQLTIVYTFAGIAKLNYDWLVRAMPLSIWLPEHRDLPVLGYFFQFQETAYLFSWFGAFYDLTIAYFLMNKHTRWFAYLAVIVFHVLTKLLFNIGLFPFIMIFSTLIFFPASVHEKWLKWIGYNRFTKPQKRYMKPHKVRDFLQKFHKPILYPLLILFFIIQLLLPLRHFLYKGNLLWTEEGYRFSWRVMLVEKSGQAIFKIKDPKTGRQSEIINGYYLTQYQEKQMCIQPDFILQFAHFIQKEYQAKHGIEHPIVTVDAHVVLNGRLSQQFIEPTVNLATIKPSLLPKSWVVPFSR